MNEVIKIFRDIQETSGKNDKQYIIAANKNNELFKKCLVFLLDNNIVTGISKAKIGKRVVITNYITIDKMSFSQLMDYIEENNTGKDSDLSIVQSFIENQPVEYREFYEQMITKSLKLGIDSTTVNKAVPDLIRTWELQQAYSIDKYTLKPKEWFSLSQKLNGIHGSYYKGKLISRQGKEIKGLQHIIDDLHSMGFGEGYFIDGELIRNNTDGVSDGENFRLGTGIINSDSVDKSCIQFIIYEVFPVNEFDNGESKKTYKDRLTLLNEFNEASHKVNSIKTVKRLYEGTDTSKIDEWLNYAVDHDWEGCMLNRNTTYRCLRNNGILKIKRFYTMDLPIADIVEGDGRLKGTLGAIVVKFKDNTINVGSGYSDEQREQMWRNRNELIGRILEVKYKEVTSDKKSGLESLQFPTFVCIREVGKNISYD